VSEVILVTVLGTNPQPACYTLNGRNVEANLASLALLQLLPEKDIPSQILALCTADAKEKSYRILEQSIKDTGVNVRAKCIDLQSELKDVSAFLKAITAAIPVTDVRGLMIDATHGPRHYALLAYLTIQYLAALRGIDIRGAYYGLWTPLEEGPSPFLDLRALLELPTTTAENFSKRQGS